MFKAALLSGWHVHAEGYAKEFHSMPGCGIGAVWDEDQARGQALADQLGCPFYQTAREALEAEGVTAGILCSPTTDHLPLIQLMAQLKKDIFTEKVLTVSYEEALLAKVVVEEAGLRFGISFPHLYRPAIRAARAIMDAGRLGQVTYARIRNVHDGAVGDWLPAHFYDAAQTGGGAMMDLGAHPMYTLAWLLGYPLSVQSLFTQVTEKPVEDNAVSLLRFPGGVIGVSETGFVSRGNPYTLELSGTQGSLLLHHDLQVCDQTTGMKWQAVTDLPEALPSPLYQWAHACQQGSAVPVDIGMDAAVRLSAIMDAAYLANYNKQKAFVKGQQ